MPTFPPIKYEGSLDEMWVMVPSSLQRSRKGAFPICRYVAVGYKAARTTIEGDARPSSSVYCLLNSKYYVKIHGDS